MDYQFLYQTLQCQQIEARDPQSFLDRWALHQPAIRWSFKHIKRLAGESRTDHLWVKTVVGEIQRELEILTERISECEARIVLPPATWED